MATKEEKGFFSSLWDSLSSLRFTIALLIILAVASIFGTVIPQNAAPEEYLRAYKISTYKILKILGFLDMYHAGWFVFLLALLSLNLVACSLKRFRISWRFFSHPEERLEEAQWKRFKAGNWAGPELPLLGAAGGTALGLGGAVARHDWRKKHSRRRK